MKLRYKILGLSFLLSFAYCTGGTLQQGGSEAGNPEPVKLSVIGYSSSELKQTHFLTLPANNLEVDVAQIVLEQLRFRPLSFCEGESEEGTEIRFDGPFVVDLLAEAPFSTLAGVEVPPDTYCKIELRLDVLDPQLNSGNPISGNSVWIQGSRFDGIPFIVRLERDEEFELENETTGFLVDPALSLDAFFIALDLDRWFSGVDLMDPGTEISMDGEGHPVIYIDENHNTELRQIILDNLETSADLFEDKNDNGDLESEEQEDSLAEGMVLP